MRNELSASSTNDETPDPPEDLDLKGDFRKGLESLINLHCMENGSDTPDFILANYLVGCIETFDKTLKARENWYGRDLWIDKRDGNPAIANERD